MPPRLFAFRRLNSPITLRRFQCGSMLAEATRNTPTCSSSTPSLPTPGVIGLQRRGFFHTMTSESAPRRTNLLRRKNARKLSLLLSQTYTHVLIVDEKLEKIAVCSENPIHQESERGVPQTIRTANGIRGQENQSCSGQECIGRLPRLGQKAFPGTTIRASADGRRPAEKNRTSSRVSSLRTQSEPRETKVTRKATPKQAQQ